MPQPSLAELVVHEVENLRILIGDGPSVELPMSPATYVSVLQGLGNLEQAAKRRLAWSSRESERRAKLGEGTIPEQR